MNLNTELAEIGRIISSVELMITVRNEVQRVASEGFVVTDGRHHPGGSGYDIVVRCGKDGDAVARRIRDVIPNVRVDEMAKGVLGLKASRRGRG